MASDLMGNLVTTGSIKIKKRKIITIRLLDKVGAATVNPMAAYKTSIIVQNDVASVDVSKTFTEGMSVDEKKAISVIGYEAETEGLFKKIELEEDESIADAIIPHLYKMTYIDLTIQGVLGEEKISRGLMATMLSKFSCININNRSLASIEFPSGDFKLESFALNGGNILLLSGGVSIEADKSITLESVNFYTNTTDPVYFNMLGNDTTMYNVYTNTPVLFKCIAPKADELTTYTEGKISINSVKFDLTTITTNDYPEVKTDALLNISNVYSVKISDITILGAQEYKGFKLERINTLMISNVNRSSATGIYAYTVGLSDITKTYISGLNIRSEFKTDRENYAVYIANEGLGFNQSLTVSNFELGNVRLVNLGSCKADSVSFSSGKINGDYIIESSEFGTTKKLRFSEIDFESKGPFTLYGDDVVFDKCTVKLFDDDKENHVHFIKVLSNLKLDSTVFYCELPITVELGTDASLRFKDSDVSFNDMEVVYNQNTDLESLEYVNESDRVFSIENTNIVGDKLSIDSVYRITSESASIGVHKLSVKNGKVAFNPAVFAKGTSIDFAFEKVEFKNAAIETRESHSSKLALTECSGVLMYNVNDLEVEEGKLTLTTELVDSDVDVKVDSMGVGVTAMLKSKNSPGSTVFGEHEHIAVVPSMQSEDIKLFNNITSYDERDSEMVNYGSSEEELELDELFGMKS